uniref:Uncharacterized protein n=1 Tax=Podoviridae sp. cttxo15 TaxID=2826584 RepID=A0A8S5N1W6_9CAUD|nr:MAG TPA: hypothetical protein [Podoviridae sp. cttxo15]
MSYDCSIKILFDHYFIEIIDAGVGRNSELSAFEDKELELFFALIAISKLFNLLRYHLLSFIFDKRENFTVFPHDFIAVFESSALFIKICFHFFRGK